MGTQYFKECIRCQKMVSSHAFWRSAKDRSTSEFKFEGMEVCNYCAFVEHNSHAEGNNEEDSSTGDEIPKKLSMKEYEEAYGGQVREG